LHMNLQRLLGHNYDMLGYHRVVCAGKGARFVSQPFSMLLMLLIIFIFAQ